MIRWNNVQFVTSAPTLEACPPASLPELCLAGRSNVGKSSLINRIIEQKRLARTSNTPGKTQLMNYYRVNDTFFLVDLPGYGYAEVPESERKRWGIAIQEYLTNRETLQLTLHLIDIRHEPSALDEEMIYWMAVNEIPFSILLTKRDKLSKNKASASIAHVKRLTREMNIEVPILGCSADSGEGIPEVRTLIEEFTTKQPEPKPER